MTKHQRSLFYIGYKAKGNVDNYHPCLISCKNLTDEQQKEFIKWFNKVLQPIIDKKFDELN